MDLRTARQDFGSILADPHGLYLVLDRNLRIVAASTEYVRATLLWNEEIVGRNVFEVFPDNPANSTANSAGNLNASLRYVLRSGLPQRMQEQRYDVRDLPHNGAWVEKYWLFETIPVFDEGSNEVTHLVHKVQDVTDAVRLRQWITERRFLLEEQRATLDQMLQDLTAEQKALCGAQESLEKTNSAIPDPLLVEELRAALGAPRARLYFQPGEIASVSGLYGVFHTRHCELAPTRIYRRAGSEFSFCPRCGEGTYYRLLSVM